MRAAARAKAGAPAGREAAGDGSGAATKSRRGRAAQPWARPFLKWAGGKSQLLEAMNSHFPPQLKSGEVKTYFEPFLGGGSVFFHVARNYPVRSAHLLDVNEELVLTYRVVQERVEDLIGTLSRYAGPYLRGNAERRARLYADMRLDFNRGKGRIDVDNARLTDAWTVRAAQLIFLNKTCFNGLYRVNRNGEFNVPIGRYRNPPILDEPNLRRASQALSRAEIRRGDFSVVSSLAKAGDFAYYDPPYRPISRTSYFTAYSRLEFDDGEQERLASFYRELNAKGVLQMLSNSDPKNHDPKDDFFDRLYRGFKVRRVPAIRNINSDAAGRGRINELLVTNY